MSKSLGAGAHTLVEELKRLGLELPPTVVPRLQTYLSELDRWNRTVNLTALSGSMRIRRLVTEPIWIGQRLGVSGDCMDIGSGNGSPAVPMTLALPVGTITMIEPRLRRAAFLRHVAGILGIPAASVERARIEEVTAQRHVEWVTLQGVALTASLIGGIKRVCSVGTKVIWITAGSERPCAEAQRIQAPDSSTEAWIFGLDA